SSTSPRPRRRSGRGAGGRAAPPPSWICPWARSRGKCARCPEKGRPEGRKHIMHVLFVAPHFPSYQRHFVRAMHSVGAKVTGIGEASLAQLDGELKSWLHGYEQVPSVVDEQAM